jgi:hypothetical protein
MPRVGAAAATQNPQAEPPVEIHHALGEPIGVLRLEMLRTLQLLGTFRGRIRL